MELSDYKSSNNKAFRFLFVINDNFSKYTWCIPLKNKYGQTKTDDFSKILSTSKRKPLKKESHRKAELYNSAFQNFLKVKSIHHYSGFTEKDPSIAERVIRTIGILLRKTVFEKGNADWIRELPSINKYNNTIHQGLK